MKFPRYDALIEINRSRQTWQSRSLRWNYILEIQVCFFKFDLPILSSNLSFVAIEAATSSKKGRAGRIRDLSSKELISAFNRIPALEKSFWRESLNLNLNTFLVSGSEPLKSVEKKVNGDSQVQVLDEVFGLKIARDHGRTWTRSYQTFKCIGQWWWLSW